MSGPQAQSDDPTARFLGLLGDSLAATRFVRVVLANHRGSEPGLQRVSGREIVLRGERQLSLLYRYKTRDITKNLPLGEARDAVAGLLAQGFGHAHLETLDGTADLRTSKKGQVSLTRDEAPASAAATEGLTVPAGVGHDRIKQRWLSLDDPCWRDLGVTDAEGRLIPAMSRKWKQINKFVEVFDAAWRDGGLARIAADRPVTVLDYGAGKGYLSFALHARLAALGHAAQVTGVELRADMVDLCNRSARQHGLDGLGFVQGDVMHHDAGKIDVMIALHACDTATDHAIHKGIAAGAKIILCSPCCHKQIRPQLTSPALLRPMLQHGIHLGQQAEMITDSLRALLLEAHGYVTQVFEFISLEHTSKNKMILAVRSDRPAPADEVHAQIRAIKDFYGVREHCLERLLLADTPAGTSIASGASPAR
jgi:Methyltransferase domain